MKEAKTERNTKALGAGRDPENLDSTGSVLCIAGKAVYLRSSFGPIHDSTVAKTTIKHVSG